jgi:hypothetical protein
MSFLLGVIIGMIIFFSFVNWLSNGVLLKGIVKDIIKWCKNAL